MKIFDMPFHFQIKYIWPYINETKISIQFNEVFGLRGGKEKEGELSSHCTL